VLGWDYSTRWLSVPSAGLRTLNVRSTIPVCLNSILCEFHVRPTLEYMSCLIREDRAHTNLADFYDQVPSNAAIYQISNGGSGSPASYHRAAASELRLAILDLFWDKNKLAFYDFNVTSNMRSCFFSAATFYPLWNGIIPDEVMSSSTQNEAFGMFASLNMVSRRYNGSFPTTFINSGQQWYVSPFLLACKEGRTLLQGCSKRMATPPIHRSGCVARAAAQSDITALTSSHLGSICIFPRPARPAGSHRGGAARPTYIVRPGPN
jgi:neutral trehalase